MIVLNMILGILLVIGGFSCMFTPFMTFLSIGYYIGILCFVFGIMGIVRAIMYKNVTVLGVITYVLAILVGIVAIAHPGRTLIFDQLILYLVSFWFLLQGISSIAASIQKRKTVKGWYWGLIVGILGCLAGIFLCLHPLISALTTGFMVGFCFLQSGFQMIAFSAFTSDEQKNQKN